MKKRAMRLCIGILLIISCSFSVAAYEDVPEGCWYSDAVNFVTVQGWMTGISQTEFAPELPVSRAMVATVFWRMAGAPEKEYEYIPYADDLPEDLWYYQAANWAFPDLMTGYPIFQEDPPVPTGIFYTFDGERDITREQMAVVLYRWHSLQERDFTPPEEGILSVFPDREQISPWAMDAVGWCVQEGYLQGDGMQLNPQASLTRAELATILLRYCSDPSLIIPSESA